MAVNNFLGIYNARNIRFNNVTNQPVDKFALEITKQFMMENNIYITLWIQPFSPFRLNPRQREKINLNFYFHTSLWYLKKFYKGSKSLYKTFRGTAKKCEKKLT